MGILINGQWHSAHNGQKHDDYQREETQFRHWITPDGAAGPTGSSGFKAETNRYHLFISLACPWAHRTLIFRAIKSLQEHIGLTIVRPIINEQGWEFDDAPNIPDAKDLQYLHQLYTLADPDYTGRVTVPTLWDKQKHTIVSNESADIIRMFNSAFNHITHSEHEFYPEEHRDDIDAVNQLIYQNINNGVYRAGFANSQQAYEEAYNKLFATLDVIEESLSESRFLVGNKITEADWRLFTTLIRFDAVYYGHFKTNRNRIEDYPNLFSYLCELYQLPGIAETVNMEQIKTHYYYSHKDINPKQIIPKGPILDFTLPPGRQ